MQLEALPLSVLFTLGVVALRLQTWTLSHLCDFDVK